MGREALILPSPGQSQINPLRVQYAPDTWMVRDVFFLHKKVPVAPPKLVLLVPDGVICESSRHRALGRDGTSVPVEVLHEGAMDGASRPSSGSAKMNFDARG